MVIIGKKMSLVLVAGGSAGAMRPALPYPMKVTFLMENKAYFRRSTIASIASVCALSSSIIELIAVLFSFITSQTLSSYINTSNITYNIRKITHIVSVLLLHESHLFLTTSPPAMEYSI